MTTRGSFRRIKTRSFSHSYWISFETQVLEEGSVSEADLLTVVSRVAAFADDIIYKEALK